MTGTTNQINYANDLLAHHAAGIIAWKALIPTDDPDAPALIARLDAASQKAASLPACTVIDILRGRRNDQTTGEGLVRWTASTVRWIEQARPA